MKILCFGDSNTYGYDPRGFLSDRYDRCWCDLLAQETGHQVLNGGSNGRALPGCARWVDSYLTKYAPVDHMIIMMGSNDILRGSSPKQILEDMESLLNHIQRAWPDLTLTLLSPTPICLWGERFDEQLQSVTEGYRRLAQQRGILFADVRSWDLPMAFDGIHLGEEGHRVFARKLCVLHSLSPLSSSNFP